MKIRTGNLSLAGEYAAASELCRRGVYAQLTLGNLKRTDLLILSEDNKLMRIEVKSKQGKSWPNCRGIYSERVVLVFVDWASKDELERPDFYILTVQDWVDTVQKDIEIQHSKRPEKVIVMDDQNVPIFTTEINKQGQPSGL